METEILKSFLRDQNIYKYYLKQLWRHKSDWHYIHFNLMCRIYPLFFNHKINSKPVWQREWDILLLMDACRYDSFKRVMEEYGFPYKITYRFEDYISLGSGTMEYVKNNFVGRKFNDIIYITANPIPSILCKNNFYEIIPLWKFCWDKRYDTVPPDITIKYSIPFIEKYRDKRIIIHFLQPHFPTKNYHGLFWRLILKDREKAIEYYYENLKWIWFELIGFIDYLKVHFKDKKIVVSSDHGQGFGERYGLFKIYSHPNYVHVPILLKVPWLIIYT